MLLQIAEPGASTPQPQRRKIGLGIDLGTTNTLVAHYDGQSLTVLADESGQVIIPSVVHYGAEQTLVGSAAKALAAKGSSDTISSAKRFVGRSRADVAEHRHVQLTADDKPPAFATSQGAKTPVEVSADLLSAVRERSLQHVETIDGVVVTVPAYFDDAQRQATRQAAELAGLNVLRLLNEPTAAAVAYGLDSEDEGVIAVYDLGGGTFDVSILRLNRGVFEVLATGGDSALGGDDFDAALADHLQASVGLGQLDADTRRRLLHRARQAKEALTGAESVDVDMSDIAVDAAQVTIGRAQFNGLCADLINRTLEACQRCVLDADVSAIDQVVLVGGSTRMPIIAETVSTLFGKTPLSSIDPDQVVAMGAARQADILVGNRADDDVLLLDVTPLSLGVETYGGLVERIVPRNTTIPVTRAQEFTTAKDGQTGLVVHVVQGEREQVADCRSLATFELGGIPPMTAGAARIVVTFQVDADGLLEVSATEQTTGTSTSVVVKPSYGLAEEEVTEMLRASYQFAAEDMASRQLAEARVEAEQLTEGIAAALNADGDLLDAKERADIESAVAHLQDAAQGADAETLRAAIKQTSQVTETFAARRMDRSIKKALGGVSLAQLDEEIEP